jgi:hypothetical protein
LWEEIEAGDSQKTLTCHTVPLLPRWKRGEKEQSTEDFSLAERTAARMMREIRKQDFPNGNSWQTELLRKLRIGRSWLKELPNSNCNGLKLNLLWKRQTPRLSRNSEKTLCELSPVGWTVAERSMKRWTNLCSGIENGKALQRELMMKRKSGWHGMRTMKTSQWNLRII